MSKKSWLRGFQSQPYKENLWCKLDLTPDAHPQTCHIMDLPVMYLDIFIPDRTIQKLLFKNAKRYVFSSQMITIKNHRATLLACWSAHCLRCSGSSRLARSWEGQCDFPWFNGRSFKSANRRSTEKWAPTARTKSKNFQAVDFMERDRLNHAPPPQTIGLKLLAFFDTWTTRSNFQH